LFDVVPNAADFLDNFLSELTSYLVINRSDYVWF